MGIRHWVQALVVGWWNREVQGLGKGCRAVLKTAMKEVIQIMTALNAKRGRTEVALGTVMLAQHQ